ncbi:DNA-directed DNA polymerase alpha catalytic subunit pol1 [Geranomyces michiganensis]|nr:DNA-directed DNA polymerase alpha catalytic subunit pol1 [Geranomyces michiganensis]
MNGRKSALEKLKASRQHGVAALSSLDKDVAGDEEDVYEEVTEEEYTALRRRRMEEGGNFVVDDDGLGYVDYGQDEWASEGSGSSLDEEDEDDAGKSAKAKRKRGKENKQKKQQPGTAGNIQNMLNKQAQNPKPKSKPAAAALTAADEQELMGSIFDDLEKEVVEHRPKKIRSAYDAPASPSARYEAVGRHQQRAHKEQSAKPNPAEVKVEAQTLSPAVPPDENPYSFDTQGVSFAPDDDDTMFDSIDDQAITALEANREGAESSVPEIVDPVVQVKVRALQKRTAKQTSSLSFAPKFERAEEAALPIEATVVAVPENANCQGWMAMKDTVKVSNFEPQSTQELGARGSMAGLFDVLEADGSLRMFWFDATEVDGVVYLFGKVQNKENGSYISCCSVVNNIQRNVFVLPREKLLGADGLPTDKEVTMTDVFTEFDELRRKHRVTEFASAKVSRNYAFELPGVPAEAEYLKVVYPFSQPELPTKLAGKSFSRVFGANTSALEMFVLKRKLMGPCWVEIKNAKLIKRNLSWCKVEVAIDDPKTLNPFKDDDDSAPKKSPPLVVLSLTMRTVTNHVKHVNEIVAASGLVYNAVNIDGASNDDAQPARFTVLRQLEDIPLPAGFQDMLRGRDTRIEIPRNEHGLLGFLIAQIHRSDPDIIVGHNFIDFDLDVLLHRMKANNVPHWSKLGRLHRKKWPKLQQGAGGTADSTHAEKQVASGRLLCDTYRAAQDLIRSKSYSLTQLAASQLNVDRPSIDYEKLHTYFWDAAQLMQMVHHTEFDAYLQAQLMFKLQILPLTKQLTNLAGNLWARTMTGARAERNEYLLLHEFHNRKYIVPDRSFGGGPKVIVDQQGEMDGGDDGGGATKKTANGRRKPAYAGGLVLEPKKGFYDKFVLLLDFNSLYPSIIQEYNICFTTVERNAANKEADELPELPDSELAKGILPRLLGTLVDRRRVVKNLMKDPRATPVELAQYDIRQKGLKLTANSMYGCLGFAMSRFYAKPLAMLITAKGREILQNTVHVAEEERLDVIYGDTDSIMINTNCTDLQQVKKIGNDFKKAVNKRYKLLEIEMDGFYQRMLLLKKKKYAALAVEETKDGSTRTVLETKGLDLVRRDWCGLSQDVSSFILDQIFSGAPKEEALDKIHQHLATVGQEVRAGVVPIEKFIVNKGLTKNPQDYADKKAQPHVQVALQMKARGIVAKIGDTIPYVICTAGADADGDGPTPGASMAERARHPDDVRKSNGAVKIDFEWYLATQVHPPVARLCAPIEGTDIARLADCLGLDPSKYHATSAAAAGANGSDGLGGADALYTLDSQLTDAERYKDVDPWMVKCFTCGDSAPFEGVVRVKDAIPTSSLTCPSATCGAPLPQPTLTAQLSTAIRTHIKRYANAYLICSDPTCPAAANPTRHMGVYAEKCLTPHCNSTTQLAYPDTRLYTQLAYYESLFNIEAAERRWGGAGGSAAGVVGGGGGGGGGGASRDMLGIFNSIVLRDGAVLGRLAAGVRAYVEKNARRYVDLRRVFAFVTPVVLKDSAAVMPAPPVVTLGRDGDENAAAARAAKRRRSDWTGPAAAGVNGTDVPTSSRLVSFGLGFRAPRLPALFTLQKKSGTSSLYTGERRSKDDDIFEALGTTDELSSLLGLAIAYSTDAQNGLEVKLHKVQCLLQDIGSNIATPRSNASDLKLARTTFDVDGKLVDELETWIDELDAQLPQLKNFILPSGGKAASTLHMARSVARRAERRAVPIVAAGVADESTVKYLNRLSDFLFNAARFAAKHEGQVETIYRKFVTSE